MIQHESSLIVTKASSKPEMNSPYDAWLNNREPERLGDTNQRSPRSREILQQESLVGDPAHQKENGELLMGLQYSLESHCRCAAVAVTRLCKMPRRKEVEK